MFLFANCDHWNSQLIDTHNQNQSYGKQFITLAAICFSDCISSFNKTMQACLGDNLILECSTAEEAGSTVFQGDLLNCSSSHNEIALCTAVSICLLVPMEHVTVGKYMDTVCPLTTRNPATLHSWTQ